MTTESRFLFVNRWLACGHTHEETRSSSTNPSGVTNKYCNIPVRIVSA